MRINTLVLVLLYVFAFSMGSIFHLSDTARFLSYIAGISGLFITGFIIEIDRSKNKFDIMNPKYFVLLGFSIFIFIGMIKFSFEERNLTYKFYEVFLVILLCYASYFSFLLTINHHSKSVIKQSQTSYRINFSKLIKISFLFFIISNFIALFGFSRISGYDSPYFNIVGYALYAGPVSSIYTGYILFIKKIKMNLVMKILLLTIFISGFLLGTSRTPVTYIIISLLIIFTWNKYKSRPGLITHYKINTGKVILISVIILFVAGIYKASNIFYEEKSRISDLDINYALQHGYRFEFVDAFQNIFLIKNLFIDNGDYFYGETILAALVNPIPRFIWPDKPKSLGYLLPERLQGNAPTLSLSTSFIGEFFVNFSYPGPIIGYFLLALVASYYYKKYKQNSKDEYFIITYSVFLVLMLLETRGDFLTVNVRGVSYIFITWLGLKLSSTKIKREPVQ
ncbi:MAG: oligosaccharide repeat unit polymerase [Ignavibacterium album]|uniref:O-antigen polymerase n=1 Tax=Ignavibacterium album TaxID=591197 RepID=UPI0026F178C5|nr:O-antigen polymerase [Ignavibacterium album]MCX8104705.1 oligosaccharide repeat unit polymerase [Ignavibacterium album]